MSTTETSEKAATAAVLALNPVSEPAEAPPGLCDAAVSSAVSGEVLIHVRFRPDARVWEIAERPEGLDNEQWFKVLCERFGIKYQTRAGGRGFFRLTRIELEAAKAFRPQ